MISVLDTRGVALGVAATETRPSSSCWTMRRVSRVANRWTPTWRLETLGGSGRGAEMLRADPSDGRPFRPSRRIAEEPSGAEDHEEAACLERGAATA
jgi:hypothetical protein